MMTLDNPVFWGGNTALSRFRLFESFDVDETRERIADVMQPHELTPLARTHDRPLFMDYLPLGKMGIGIIKLGRMLVDVGEVGDYHLLICCHAGKARIVRDGGEVDIDKGTGVCLAPGERFRGEFSGDCEQLVMRIDPALLDTHSGRRQSRLRPGLELRKPLLRPWLRMVNDLLWDEAVTDLMHQNDRIAEDYEHLLINLLVAGQELVPETSKRTSIAPASVRRAEAFIRENYSDIVKLDDVAAAAEVPTRTLLDAFRQFRGVSPMRYLREVRLEAVRNRLLSGPEANVSILALDAGFGHLGRFAREYKDRYGEAPSETRSRMKQRRH